MNADGETVVVAVGALLRQLVGPHKVIRRRRASRGRARRSVHVHGGRARPIGVRIVDVESVVGIAGRVDNLPEAGRILGVRVCDHRVHRVVSPAREGYLAHPRPRAAHADVLHRAARVDFRGAVQFHF